MRCSLTRCVSLWPIYARTGTLSPRIKNITHRNCDIGWMSITPPGGYRQYRVLISGKWQAAVGCDGLRWAAVG